MQNKLKRLKKLKELKKRLYRLMRAAKEQRQFRTRLALAYATSRPSRLLYRALRQKPSEWR